jgi:molybdenum cofactor cytidylyltransferase
MSFALPAIIPAAGLSRRMGRPKLTLPLSDGITVLGRVLDALAAGGAQPLIVIGPPRDALGWQAISDDCEHRNAVLSIPDDQTADMRESVTLGLAALGAEASGFLLTPGDSVGITPELVAHVIERFHLDPSRIVIPVHNGKRGHPVAFPRDLIDEMYDLPHGVGLNAIRERHLDCLELVEVNEAGSLLDLDTPDDYRRAMEA